MTPRALLGGPTVRLDALCPDDAPTLVAWERDTAGTRLHLSNEVMPSTEAQWRARIDGMIADRRCYPFAIRRRSDDELVGEATLDGVDTTHRRAGLGISLAAAHRGHGHGTEALGLLLAFAFDELNLHRVEIGVFSYNVRAVALYERLGFVHEGRARQWGRRDGVWFDLVHMGLLEPDWRAHLGAARPALIP